MRAKDRVAGAATCVPQTTIETRFMQNYRVASAVNGGGEIVAVRNGRGQVEAFTTGTDSMVWNFYPDPTSDTGYRSASTGLQAGTLSAGVDESGNIVLFTSQNQEISYVVETPGAPSRWSAPVAVSLPPRSNADKIAAIITQQIAGQLYVGVLTQYQSATGLLYAVAWSAWDTASPSFNATSMSVLSPNCVWLGDNPENAAFACVDTVIVALTVSTGAITTFPMNATFDSLAAGTAVDAAGNNQIFAVLADGNMYHLIGGAGGEPYSFAQLSQGMSFRQMGVVADDTGAIGVFAVNGDNRVYHWESEGGSLTGYSSPPASIALNAALLGVATNDGGAVDLFIVGTGAGALNHLYEEEVSTNWVSDALEVPANGEVEQLISYATDVTVHDAAGALLPNTPVNVWAAEQAEVTINGAVYFVNAGEPASLSTNGAGMLSLSQAAGALTVPALQINIPSQMTPGQSIALDPSAGVQGTLATVTGPDLMSATTADGSYLIPGQYRTTETTDAMAAAFNQCMSLDATPDGGVAMETRRGARPGVWLRSSGSAAGLGRLRPSPDAPSWRLSFEGGRIRYSDLSRGEARALIARAHASYPSASSWNSWLGDIGDFVAGVVDGVITVVDTVVTAVTEGVEAVFTLVIDGVTYVFDAVVTAIEQAFDVVEAFFAQVEVYFEDLFSWLGFLFDWDDILRTQSVASYTLNQFLAFLPGAVSGIQSLIDDGIANLSSQIPALFSYATETIAGSSTIGGYEQASEEPSPDFSYSVSNNIFYNWLIDNAYAGVPVGGLFQLSGTALASVTRFIDQVTAFVESTETTPAFQQAVAYFTSLGGSLDQIFSTPLAGLMSLAELMLQAILSGAQAIIDSLLKLVQTLLSELQGLLDQVWSIPLVSPMYAYLTDGSELTTLDLIALVTAIPATILYKLVTGAAPFPDQASVTDFEASFNAQTMLAASGLGGAASANTLAQTTGALLSPSGAEVVGVFASVATWVFGVLSAMLDIIPFGTGTLVVLPWSALLAEVLVQAFTFPWFTLSGAPDGKTEDGAAMTLWIYMCIGALLDLPFVYYAGTLPECWDDIGVGITFFYGCGHLVTAIIASVPVPKSDPVTVSGYILNVIPELFKPLRWKAVYTSTAGLSLAVLGGADVLCYVTVGATILITCLGGSTDSTGAVARLPPSGAPGAFSTSPFAGAPAPAIP